MFKVKHSWLYGTVKPYFETQGIYLLRDDLQFIEKCLAKIPEDRHRLVMRDYFKIWRAENLLSFGVQPGAYSGRFEANSYLRNTCEN